MSPISSGSGRLCWPRRRGGRRASVTSTATTSRSRSGRITPSTGSGRASSSCRRPKLRALGSLVSIADGRGFFSGDPDAPFRADAPLDQQYREYILKWLTGAGRRPGRHVAFDVRADARHDRRIRAEGARHPQRAAAQHPAAGARLSSRRRHLAVGDVARARSRARCHGRRRGVSSWRTATAMR